MKVIKSLFRGLFTLILVLLLVVTLVLVVYTTNVKGTLLSPAYVEKELDKVDIFGAAKERLGEEKYRFTDQMGAEGERIYNVLEESVTREWTNGQVHYVLGVVYPFIKSETNNLDITVSLAGLKENMKTELRQTVYDSPPESLRELPLSEIEKYLDDANVAIDDLPGEVQVQVENPEALDKIRSAVEAFNLLYRILIALAVFLALLLAFLHFRLKSTFRVWGFSLLLGGAGAYAIAAVAVSRAPDLIAKTDLPSPFTPDMLLTAVEDFFSTPNLYGIGIGAAGLVLFIVSFFLAGPTKATRKRKMAKA